MQIFVFDSIVQIVAQTAEGSFVFNFLINFLFFVLIDFLINIFLLSFQFSSRTDSCMGFGSHTNVAWATKGEILVFFTFLHL